MVVLDGAFNHTQVDEGGSDFLKIWETYDLQVWFGLGKSQWFDFVWIDVIYTFDVLLNSL